MTTKKVKQLVGANAAIVKHVKDLWGITKAGDLDQSLRIETERFAIGPTEQAVALGLLSGSFSDKDARTVQGEFTVTQTGKDAVAHLIGAAKAIR